MPEFPADDKEAIPDDELLFRRIYPDPGHLVPLGDGTGYRPQSGALRSPAPLSVDRASLSTPEETRDRDKSSPFHVAAVPAGAVRSVGCKVVRDPEQGNLAHCLVYGQHADGKGGLSGGQAEKIARKARIVLLNPAAV